MNNIRKPIQIKAFRDSIIDESIERQKNNKIDENNDLFTLRDSLTAKQQLITLLEKGGYVKDNKDIASISNEINEALKDLNAIIKSIPDA